MSEFPIAAASVVAGIAAQLAVFWRFAPVARWRWTARIILVALGLVAGLAPAALLWAAFLWLGYTHFFFLADRSVSVRLLRELSWQRPQTRHDLRRAYDPEALIARRLADLTAGGYAIERIDGFVLTPKGGTCRELWHLAQWALRARRGG